MNLLPLLELLHQQDCTLWLCGFMKDTLTLEIRLFVDNIPKCVCRIHCLVCEAFGLA